VTPWTSIAISSAASESAPAATSSSAAAEASPERGLSKGGIAGIAIMCLVVGIGIGVAAILLFRRYRRRQDPEPAMAADQHHSTDFGLQNHEAQVKGIDQSVIHASGMAFAPSSTVLTPELHSDRNAVEMEAREPGPQLAELQSGAAVPRELYEESYHQQIHANPATPSQYASATTPIATEPGVNAMSPEEEMDLIQQQQAQLQAKRATLQVLQEIEEKEKRLESRLAALRSGQSSS
jgi:hypothetical protein